MVRLCLIEAVVRGCRQANREIIIKVISFRRGSTTAGKLLKSSEKRAPGTHSRAPLMLNTAGTRVNTSR